MNDRAGLQPITLSISAVERDTGLSKDTLRVWERRYGFPQPGRDAFGERLYPLEQVEKLRALRRLMDLGHRPGKIIGLPIEDLLGLTASTTQAASSYREAVAEEPLSRFVELVKAHEVAELRGALSQAALRLGLERFVTQVVAPLNWMIGDAWARGYLEIFEEHQYTESMQVVLRNAISSIPTTRDPPCVLLTTFPNEVHGLGLLMAEAILSLEGGNCISLGTQTPVLEIVRAARAQRADIVALSFSACLGSNQVIDGLAELRDKLPGSTEIWAGGQCQVLQRKTPQGVVVLNDLTSIGSRLAQWRATVRP